MANEDAKQALTRKPITEGTIVDDEGRVVASHGTTVVTDPESADAVQTPPPGPANQTEADPLAVHSEGTPNEAFSGDVADINEVQRIDPTGAVTGGTYTFVLAPGTASETTFTDVAFDADAAAVNALIVANPVLVDAEDNPNVVASGVAVSAGNLDFTFQNDLGGQNVPELTVDDANITGGGTLAAVTVTEGVAAG